VESGTPILSVPTCDERVVATRQPPLQAAAEASTIASLMTRPHRLRPPATPTDVAVFCSRFYGSLTCGTRALGRRSAPPPYPPRVINDEGVDQPTEEHGENDEIQVGNPLTPEERESLRRTAANVREFLASSVKLPTLTVPESVFRNAVAASDFVGVQRALVADAIKPLLDAQAAWRDQIAGMFASDAFKVFAQSQGQFAEIATQLSKTIDFGFADNAATLVGNFIEQQSSWLQNLGPAIAAFKASYYPPNLRAIEGLEFADVEVVVMSDGIPLYGVPRTTIAEALIGADNLRQRREILGRRWRTISADCREGIEGCTSGAVAPYVPFALAALDALDAGHTEAAQALAGSLVDTVVTGYFGNDRTKYTPHPQGKRTTDAYYGLTVRDLTAFAPVWLTYQQFFVSKGDKIPSTFSRHATAHAVSARQYSRRNAVQGLMLACSLLYRIDEKFATLEATA
jgi:hypothetical protein